MRNFQWIINCSQDKSLINHLCKFKERKKSKETTKKYLDSFALPNYTSGGIWKIMKWTNEIVQYRNSKISTSQTFERQFYGSNIKLFPYANTYLLIADNTVLLVFQKELEKLEHMWKVKAFQTTCVNRSGSDVPATRDAFRIASNI